MGNFICGYDPSTGEILGWWPEERASEVLGTALIVDEPTWREAATVIYADRVDPEGPRFWRAEQPPAPYVPINLPVDLFFERTTEEEAEEIETAMLAKPVKIKRAYQAATTFKEGTDLWAALWAELETLFGAPRRDELMARPTANEMSRPAE